MTGPVLKARHLKQLTEPGQRLPGLTSWLLNELWSESVIEAATCSPRSDLLHDEGWVKALETLMTAAGDHLYAEFTAPSPEESGIGQLMSENPGAAVVMFHGCSLREIPRLVQLVRDSRRKVRARRCPEIRCIALARFAS